ncbi:adenosine receptor A2b-like [Diadema antillarum]|uniref:adenosine receptor A2b-like n=1 Tax=Diadema antillarum TaxID=105358 RepID=UPI003A8ACA39
MDGTAAGVNATDFGGTEVTEFLDFGEATTTASSASEYPTTLASWQVPRHLIIVTGVSVAIQIILLVVIFAGNGVVIFTVARDRRLWTSSNFFVVSLASADVFVSLAMIPGVNLTLDPTFVNNIYTCLLVWCSILFSTSASCLSLLAITVDRYVKIIRPYRYQSLITETRVTGVIVIIWLYTFAVTCVLPLAGVNELVPGSVYCFEFIAVFNVVHIQFIIIVNGIIPFVIMFAMYSHLFAIAQQKLKAERRATGKFHSHAQSQMKSFTTLMIILGFTCLAWIPSNTLVFMDLYMPAYAPGLIPRTVLSWLTYLNSAVNPFIYALRSDTFRAAARRAFALQRNSSLYVGALTKSSVTVRPKATRARASMPINIISPDKIPKDSEDPSHVKQESTNSTVSVEISDSSGEKRVDILP